MFILIKFFFKPKGIQDLYGLGLEVLLLLKIFKVLRT
jgi:hypothetical protein